MHARLRQLLPIDDIRTCYHTDNDHCDCRKPKPGMLIAAARDHGLDLSSSFMIGDRWRDIDAGRAAGCRTVLIDRAYAERRAERPDMAVSSLLEAAQFILNDAPKVAIPSGTDHVRTISLIVPALNEEKVITQTVRQILSVVKGCFAGFELVLIDDGSTDETAHLMEELANAEPNVRVIHNPRNLGLGACYRRGVEEARYRYVMLLCGDGGMPASSLPRIFDHIGEADIVIPYITNLRQIKSLSRFLISRTYTGLLNTIFGFSLNYYNGLAVHRVELVRCLNFKSDGFGFQAEILVKLLKAGCSYAQVGVEGAEKTRRSSALRFWSIVNVVQTLGRLVGEVGRFDCSPVVAARQTTPRSGDEAKWKV